MATDSEVDKDKDEVKTNMYKRRNQRYKTPTLNDLLTDYSYEQNSRKEKHNKNVGFSNQNEIQTFEKRRQKRPLSHKDSSRPSSGKSANDTNFFKEEFNLIVEEPKIILERRKAKDQRLLNQMTKTEQERYLYYLTFNESRMEKEKRRRQEERIREANRLKMLQKKQEEAHKFNRRLEKVVLSTDNSFLKSLPKSKMHETIKVEQELIKHGSLMYQTERDKFWEEIQHRGNDKKTLNMLKAEWTFPIESPRDEEIIRVAESQEDKRSHYQERISEVDEISRPSTQRTLMKTGRLSAKQLEQLFPKAEEPQFKSSTINFSEEKKYTPEEEKYLNDLNKRRSKRKRYNNLKKQMFGTAQTHIVTTKRILETRVDDDFEELGEDLNKMIYVKPHRKPALAIKQSNENELPVYPDFPISQKQKYRLLKDQTLEEFKASTQPPSRMSGGSEKSTVDEIRSRSSSKAANLRDIPLTFSEATEKAERVVIPGPSHVYWNNYAQKKESHDKVAAEDS